MRIVFYLLTTGIAALVTWGFSLLILRLSRRFRLYPQIRDRDVHTNPTPRLGGVAMFLGVLVAIGVASIIPQLGLVFADSEVRKILGVLVAALIIVVIGVIDDLWDLDWLTKLAGQLIAAGAVAWGGVVLGLLPTGDTRTIFSPFQSLIITVIAVVVVMNAVNFIDGLDGLVAGVALIANGVFFIYSYVLQSTGNAPYFTLASLITSVLIGACIGFLPVNFHPAKMFMGDAGALLVGLLMAVSAISITGSIDPQAVAENEIGRRLLFPAYIPLLLPIAILIVPFLDFGLAVLRRLRAGKSPFSADRKHLHHRLLDMGHPHLHAVLIFYASTAVVSIGSLSLIFVAWGWALLFVVVGLAIIAAVTLAPVGRAKRLEAASQLATPGGPDVAPDAARFDPLDAAADEALDDEGLDDAAPAAPAAARSRPKDARP